MGNVEVSQTNHKGNNRHAKHHEHDKHAGHSVGMFKKRFWISLILTIPVLVYSEMIQNWLRFIPPAFYGAQYIPLIFSTIIFFYGGWVFIKGAVNEIKSRMLGMMTLISLAIITAYIYSVATQFFIKGDNLFWELATLVTIMLLGHWLEMASIAKAESALDAISELLPDKADKIIDGKPTQVLVSELKVGDMVLVRPGSSVPVDGVITDGASSINESAITGESKLTSKNIGDNVVAGTVNQDGSLSVKVTKIGDDTALAGIMRLVAEAQSSKSHTQILADKAAFALTIIAIATSVIAFIYWLITKDATFALQRSVAILVIACPHALGLAIPLVVSISTTLSARNGLLVRKRLALESARRLDWVLFDKTGTLTKGEHGVTDIWAIKERKQKDILQITASLEQNSEHVIGKGIVAEAEKNKLKLSKLSNFSALPGLGVQGKLNGKEYLAVSYQYLLDKKLNIPEDIEKEIKKAAKQGKTEVYLIEKGTGVIGAIALADIIREQSKRTIESLKSNNIKTAMITGDSQDVADYVATQLGLDKYYADVKPGDKANKIKELQAKGAKVAFVGDGINDAPALAQADIGLAIGAGTDVAIKSADIILIKNDPEDVIRVIELSRSTYNKMVQNLVWATGYNVLAIPLAAGVLYGFGILLSPAAGAILMSASTIIVALNAQLLRRIRLN